jgi:L-asparaginase II
VSTPPVATPTVIAEVVRSGFVEATHSGTVVGLAADGSVALSIGDPAAPVFPRSCNKPLQAVGMLRAGIDVDDRQLALIAASHSGLDEHVAIARSILASVGLDERALANTPGLPVDEQASRALIASGGGPDRLHQNCSGKHAGMLAACVAAGWPLSGYLDPDHPLQCVLRATVEELAGEEVEAVGVDGCGAPLFAVSLLGVARAFVALVRAAEGEPTMREPLVAPSQRVADAMRAHPDVVGGPDRVVTRLMHGVPGLLSKDGAEGAFVGALPDGRVVAVKVADGASRAAGPVFVDALRALGVDAPVFAELATSPVYGGGRVVGEVRAVPLSG